MTASIKMVVKNYNPGVHMETEFRGHNGIHYQFSIQTFINRNRPGVAGPFTP
jgi:hypothetical protein